MWKSTVKAEEKTQEKVAKNAAYIIEEKAAKNAWKGETEKDEIKSAEKEAKKTSG